jgi:hypothetical protein
VIKRKAEMAAEERRKEAERRRLERERLERLEKARVGRLLAQTKSLRRPRRFAPTSQPFESAKPRSTIPSVQRNFNSGRTGHSASESTLSSLAASERFKTTIEARQRRLILGGAGGWCDDFVRLGDRRK